ncbi:MerR family transcriptional regulator [Pseudonocardia abyssalis]|uniref:MerR family transcriptional regulator n=1 Tax=Pseudonocardia abyssalis TaxID=2792008 RepID=A0ABS6UX12_9PSEU|nr:MerR family transcriptional regulator [Pseudonocardia abyssalis]MBW0115492.1 MerR family transcriptional regulator [Pseudonocardia abyssalis]MBW0136712.1 MerR family transcriptional regulator [Pseudonocardia abyssalis]
MTGQLTIDQLAERTGVTVRTIRFWAGRGLLPPPALRGRTGFYGPDHVARLELVSELSALGFTLSAIEGHLGRVPPSASAAELALQRALLTPWVPEQIEEVDRAELDRRAGRTLAAADVDALQGLGMIEVLDGDRIRLHGSGTLGEGLAVIDSGLPVDVWRRAHQIIEQHTTALAEDLMKVFQDEVLQPYRDRGRPADERTRLAEAFSQLKPITVRGVVTAFGRAVNRTIRERVG